MVPKHYGKTIEQALQQGVAALKEGSLRKAESIFRSILRVDPDNSVTFYNLGITLNRLGEIERAIENFRQAIRLRPNVAVLHFQLGIALEEVERAEEAENCYRTAISLNPNHSEAHNNLGLIQKKLGNLEEAKSSFIRCLECDKSSFRAASNLCNTLRELGRLEEAEAYGRRAISLRPDFADACNALGSVLYELDRLEEAEGFYKQAIRLKPDLPQAQYNFGVICQELSRLDEAVASYARAIALKPNYAEAYVNLSLALKNVRFTSSNRELYPPLLKLLVNGNYTRPNYVAGGILSLLKHDPLVKALLLKKNVVTSPCEATALIKDLDGLTLLHQLMRICPLPQLEFEELFVSIRGILLKNLDRVEVSNELIYFLSTLSLHCFTNEYVYSESAEETCIVEELEQKMFEIVMQSKQPKTQEILCLASYRPLHGYDWCQQLAGLDYLEEVKLRLIEEPIAEKMIAQDIPTLGIISDDVSNEVKAQYEKNPYPRWIKAGVPLKAKSIAELCRDANLYLHSKSIASVTAPTVLIAGCGTGQHSIETTARFSKCNVIAIDLSLASLAYAKRKADELHYSNLEFLQADILHLHQLHKKFDIIESGGVLHHMNNPMEGWKILADTLKPGGLMKIGLYSELARQHIVRIREEITSLRTEVSEVAIREFRGVVADSNDKDHRLLRTSSDFFSVSSLRDLVFHAKEHRFTLPQIKNCLDELGLKFCGFENNDAVFEFKKLNGQQADIYDLSLWHQYEESHPRTFAGMYQFWCQK